jgi:hypothetical protein
MYYSSRHPERPSVWVDAQPAPHRPDVLAQRRHRRIRSFAGFLPDRGVAAVVLVNDQRSPDRAAMRLLSMI